MEELGLTHSTLVDENGHRVGLVATYDSGRPGRWLCLNACLDTAGFGNIENWSFSPTSGEIRGGWLHGRGAADSKIAAALFGCLMRDLIDAGMVSRGGLILLLDADEHSGVFGGVRSMLRTLPTRPSGLFIGYPGDERILVGARGFLRGHVRVYGVAEHSGRGSRGGANAIRKMAALVSAVEDASLAARISDYFPLGPRMTVTSISGGEGFSQVPDVCTCLIDIRLTPYFDRRAAETFIGATIKNTDRDHPTPRASKVTWEGSWPAYRLPETEPIVEALTRAAREVYGYTFPHGVSGPSNIGNYLGAIGIPAVCGFGVPYENIHAANERADLNSAPQIYDSYRRAADIFLNNGESPSGV